jgi:methyltransferase (TIGR00027 family)
MMYEFAANLARTTIPEHSASALMAAAARAAHLIVDAEPRIFADTLAETLLGAQADELIAYHRRHGDHVVLAGARAQATCRSRITEAAVAAGFERGITQYVLLGAGLDSFAYRSPLAFTVFEVDHPASQAWKRARLADAGIAEPSTVSYVPVDLEAGTVAKHLIRHGFDPARPAIVSWLGVSMYLTSAAVAGVLDALGGLAPGTEIVFDYMLPDRDRDANGRTYVEMVAPGTAERGEPWLTFLSVDDATALLARAGFRSVEHVRQRDLPVWDRTDALRPASLSVVGHARIG